jgi:flagellar hook-associated protein 3 FlgL
MALQTRVTGNSIAARVLSNLQHNLSGVGKIQEQLSSGKLINRPSDSPTGAVSAMQLRGEMRTVQQYERNADDGLNWLSTIDTTLTSSLTQMTRVRDLTLQGMSSGAAGSTEARHALAAEVDNIRESLISLANTTYLGRPVFGGTTDTGKAFNGDGTWAGNTGVVKRTVGDGAQVDVNVDGTVVFGTGTQQLFTILSDISTHLKYDPSKLGADLDRLDIASGVVKTQLADVGARYNRVEHMHGAAGNRLLDLTSQLSEVEDIDLPYTIMQMQLQQTAYEAALASTAKVIQPSLIDFLR